MKRVRILVYDGARNDVERSIQYRNVKGAFSPRAGTTISEHFVPDTHVVVEIDRADHKVLQDLVEALRAGTCTMISLADLEVFERISNGVYGGDVRV